MLLMRRVCFLTVCLFVAALSPFGALAAEPEAQAEAEAKPDGLERIQACWREFNKTVAGAIGPLEIGLALTGYYDWHDRAEMADETYQSLDGVGGGVQLTFDWQPIESGSLQGEFRYIRGHGATEKLVEDGATLGAVNELASDTTNGHLQVQSLYYQQSFFKDTFFAAIGKTEPETWIDQNSYANDEFGQFVDQAFVADPVLDNEDEQMPGIAAGVQISESVQAQAVVLASSQGGEKDEFDKPFETPFVGGQVAYSTKIGERSGVYRLVGFTATYEHEELQGDSTQPGYGVGVNFEQEVTEKIALFGRAYWHDEQVYNIPWAFSVGMSGQGLIPERPDDVLGIGSAFLVADDKVNTGGVETHLEVYYKVALWSHVFITPDLRYIVAPLGNSDNDDIVTAMLRLQLVF
jgi:hypothetical protein